MINTRLLENTLRLSVRGNDADGVKSLPELLKVTQKGQKVNPRTGHKETIVHLEDASADSAKLKATGTKLAAAKRKNITTAAELKKANAKIAKLEEENKKLNAELDKAFDAGFQPED